MKIAQKILTAINTITYITLNISWHSFCYARAHACE